MTKAWQAICLGEAMVMITPDPPGALAMATSARLHPAGAEANVAAGLARLGHRVVWSSRLGSDPLGDRILAHLDACGVDTTLVVRDAYRQTGVYFKDPAPDGTSVFYYRRESAASAMDTAHLEPLPLATAEVVHISGINLALSPSCASMINSLVSQMTDHPGLVSFDVNHRPGLWAADDAAEPMLGLAARCDVVYVGLDEAELLWGTTTPEAVRELLPTPLLVVKDGAVGATEFGPDDTTFVPAPVVEVVEPVGAGDAFAAGHLSGLLRRMDPAARLSLGHAMAGLSLRTADDLGDPSAVAALAATLTSEGHQP